jgi:hypothetical protein
MGYDNRAMTTGLRHTESACYIDEWNAVGCSLEAGSLLERFGKIRLTYT